MGLAEKSNSAKVCACACDRVSHVFVSLGEPLGVSVLCFLSFEMYEDASVLRFICRVFLEPVHNLSLPPPCLDHPSLQQ